MPIVIPQANRPANHPDLRRIGLHPSFWYPLAQSRNLKKGKTLSVAFAGEPIVLARTESGQAFALEDRCAHRQFPLHKGEVCGEMLQCAYHAWRYDTAGRVAGIPYLPKGAVHPQGVRDYPCREAYGLVFVFPGDREKVEEVDFPSLPGWHSPDHRTMYFQREVLCHYSFMHENLMDMNHQFLHRGIMGMIRPTLLDSQKGEDWLEVRYKFEQAKGKPHRGADFLMAGAGSKGPNTPSGDIMTIRTQYPYQTLSICRGDSDEPAFNLWVVYIPWDKEQRSHLTVGMLMIRKPPIPGVIYLLWPIIRRFAESVFAEDRMAVEAEQRAHDFQGADWNQEVNPVILGLREVMIRNGVPLDSAGSS